MAGSKETPADNTAGADSGNYAMEHTSVFYTRPTAASAIATAVAAIGIATATTKISL